jgi:5-methyltetrahydropteroyltriglutamate--homocysteine methyltransferase
MGYAEFNNIITTIGDMDADVILVETTRSRMELLNAFAPRGDDSARYPAEIGPGVWDSHSPRVPDAAEMTELLGLARKRLQEWQIWVNPDCGLKTRNWEEIRPALESLVAAASYLRESLKAS